MHNQNAAATAARRSTFTPGAVSMNRLVSAAMAPGGAAAAVLPDFSRWGEIERQPMRAVRRKTAEHLLAAWTTIPHVTQHDLADVTALEDVRKRFAKQTEAAGGNLTVTSIAVKVVASALKVFVNFGGKPSAEAASRWLALRDRFRQR